LAHHQQVHSTKNQDSTLNPVWSEQLYIQVLRSDVLELQVKDGNSKNTFNRFLGKIQIPILEILDRLNSNEYRFTGALSKRGNINSLSNAQHFGSISFVITDGRSSLFRNLQNSIKATTEEENEQNTSDSTSSDDENSLTRAVLSSIERLNISCDNDVTTANSSANHNQNNIAGGDQKNVENGFSVVQLMQFVLLIDQKPQFEAEKVTIVLQRRDKPINLGFTLQGGCDSIYHLLKQGIFVNKVAADSEASAAGLRVYDEIVAVDGCSLHECPQDFVESIITQQDFRDFIRTKQMQVHRQMSYTEDYNPSEDISKVVKIQVLRRDDFVKQLEELDKKKELKRGGSCPEFTANKKPQLPFTITSLNEAISSNFRQFDQTVNTEMQPSTSLNDTIQSNNELQQSTSAESSDNAANEVENATDSPEPTTPIVFNVETDLSSTLQRARTLTRQASLNTALKVATDEEQRGLPPGWQAMQDRFERILYLDHTTRDLQWNRPLLSNNDEPSSSQLRVPRRAMSVKAKPPPPPPQSRKPRNVADDPGYQNLMQRYQSMRRLVRPSKINVNKTNAGNRRRSYSNSSQSSQGSSSENDETVQANLSPSNDASPPTPLTDVPPDTPVAPASDEDPFASERSVANSHQPGPQSSTQARPSSDEVASRLRVAVEDSPPVTSPSNQVTSSHGRVRSSRQVNGQERPIRRLDTLFEQSSSSSNQRRRVPVDFRKNPAYKFICHQEFRTMLSNNSAAYNLFHTNTKIKLIVQKILKNADQFEKYQHNPDLVQFFNCFANKNIPLPSGWERKAAGNTQSSRYSQSGRSNRKQAEFYVNHNDMYTTYIDPRLPTNTTRSWNQGGVNQQESQLRNHRTGNHGSSSAPTSDRLSVQSPTITQPPQVAPRPANTLTSRSRPLVASTTSVNNGNSATSGSNPQQQVVAEEAPQQYNDKVVAYLKQDNILDIIKSKYHQVTPSLEQKIMKIKQEGQAALLTYANSTQLTIMLSLFEEDIMNFVVTDHSVLTQKPVNRTEASQPSTSSKITRTKTCPRSFHSKLRSFYRKLEQKGYGQGPTKLKLNVSRENILEEAYVKIVNLPRKELQRCKLFVTFNGEEGLDYSGPSREFFFLLSKQLFNPYYGLFEYSAIDTYTIQISPLSAVLDQSLSWFLFAGRIIGLALIHRFLLNVFFARPLYKMLLRAKLSLSDLRYLDEQFYQSMQWVKDNDVVDLELDFTVDEEKFGKTETVELKRGGKNIAVTEKNKKEYIDRMVKWRLERGTKQQTNSLIRGFNEVIDLKLLQAFDAKELELVLCGTVDINITDWRDNTEYRGGYSNVHPVIEKFWEAVANFDQSRRLKLLQFVTGTSSIPYEGFSALRGPNGPKKFTIEKWGSPASLPRAHTCFNRIDLPCYQTYELLWEKLVIAIEETSTFAIE